MIRIRKFDHQFTEMLHCRTNLSVQRLNNYLADPGPDNVHDMRTSIRRLVSAYGLVPKTLRKKKATRFVCQYVKFFKINGPIRDCDIMLEKVAGHNSAKSFAQYLSERRKRCVYGALDVAVSLSVLPTPRLTLDSYDAITSRFQKNSLRLVSEIQALVFQAMGDIRAQNKLHCMRIAVKKLRYLMEMQPGNYNDQMVSRLKNLQNMLGRIHDSDMFVDFASKKMKRYPALEPLVNHEKDWRRSEFERLSSVLGRYSGSL